METAPQHPQNPQHLRQDEQSLYKGRLQQYAQRAGLDLPTYLISQTGTPNAPVFKCSVIVGEDTYESPVTFSQKKAAEQDAAKCAWKVIFEKRVEKGSSVLSMIAALCKAMLNEFAAKLQVERPKYHTVKTQEVPLPVFVSTLEFRGVSCTGGPSKTKKDAEQLVAHDAIISILGDSEVGLTLLEVLISKAKLISSLQISNDPSCCAIKPEEGSNSAGDGASSGQLVSGSDVLIATSNEEQFKDAIASSSCALQTQGAPVPPLIQYHATPAMQTLANEGCQVTPASQADNSVLPVPSLSQNHSTTPVLTYPNEGCKVTSVLPADGYILPVPSSPQNPSIPPVQVSANEGYKVRSASQADGSVFLVPSLSQNPSTTPVQVFENQGGIITPASQAHGSVIQVDPSSKDPSCDITTVPQADSSVLPELPENSTTPLQNVADHSGKATIAPQAVVESVIQVDPSSKNPSCEISTVHQADSSVLPELPENSTAALQNVADHSGKVTVAPQAVVELESYCPPQTHILSTAAVPLIPDGSAALSSQALGKRNRNKRNKASKKARMANQMGGSLCSTLTQ